MNGAIDLKQSMAPIYVEGRVVGTIPERAVTTITAKRADLQRLRDAIGRAMETGSAGVEMFAGNLDVHVALETE